MQPTLLISAPVAGMVYLNGRFAGECAGDAPLIYPVSPRGPAYIEYRPLESGARPLARRLVLSGGVPVGVPEDLYCVSWPGGALEVELDCEERPRVRFRSAELPEGAGEPEEIPVPGGTLLLGAIGGERYAATLDADGQLNGFARFSRVRHTGDGRLDCATDRNDTVGHAVLERWQASGEGLRLLSSEGAWTHGAPRWPDTAENTAIAAFEAAILGLAGEADMYLAPELRGRNLPKSLAGDAIACGAVKYAPPDAKSAVALFIRVADRHARADCVFFRAVPAGGNQGPWQLTALWSGAS